MIRIRRFARLACVSLLLAGCATTYPPEKITFRAPPPLRNSEFFAYEKTPLNEIFLPSWSPDFERYDIFTLAFPSVTRGENVLAQYWKSKSGGKKKLIIVLPIVDSVRFVGEHYAHIMTSWNGDTNFNVLLIEDTKKIFYLDEMRRAATEYEFLSVMRQTATALKEYIIDIRRLIDWAETRTEIDAQEIGIIGGSISASLASLAMASDPRIKAGVFDKGGGNWHEIFALSEEPGLKKTRDAIMKKFSWSREELKNKIAPLLWPVDPILWASKIPSNRVLFLNAKYDRWLGATSVEAFWNALGRPNRIEFNTGHKTAFLLSLTILGGHYADYKIYNHFRENLKR